MITRIAFAAFVLQTAALAAPALAQSQGRANCGPRDLLVSKLAESYGESRMGAGLRGNASIFELWASPDSGTWTILVTDTRGVSCVMAAGESWFDMPALPTDLGAPA